MALLARPQLQAGVSTGADGATGPQWRCGGSRGGVPTAVTSSQAPGASSLFPPTWSPEPPQTKGLMQTLRKIATANSEKVTGADLNWKRKHRLREPPPPPTPSDYPLWLHPQRPPATNLARLGPCSSGSVAESRDAAGGAALGSERGSLKASWAGRLRRVRKHALCWRD